MTLPEKRPFRWRVLWILGVLLVLGNVASIPMLSAMKTVTEPPLYLFAYSVFGFILIGLALRLAGQTRLGAPLLEGLIAKSEISSWIGRLIAVSLLFAVAGSSLILLLNLNANPENVPAAWKIVLASADAGIQEEIFYRLFLLTLLVWLGHFIWRDGDDQQGDIAYWTAIIISGIIFGWAHIDDQIANPEILASSTALAEVMLVNTSFGIVLGWLYWKQGLECAMLAHFLLDAVGLGIVMPVYLSNNAWLQVGLFTGLLLAGTGAWRLLEHSSLTVVKGDKSL